jgi:ribosome maturation factor RimP
VAFFIAMYQDLMQLEDDLDKMLHDFGYQMVDLQSVGQRGRRAYRIFIDRVDAAPVTTGDCAAVSRQVRLYLEGKGQFNDESGLEVSSAGLDRVLKRERDFERFLGSKIQVTWFDGQNRQTKTGELGSFTDEVLVLEQGEDKPSVQIPRREVEKARLVPQVEFGR